MSGDDRGCELMYSTGDINMLRAGWWWRFSDAPEWYGPFANESDAAAAAKAGRSVAEPTPDDTAAPAYYVEGRKYEPHLVIEDWGLNHNMGSVMKYVARYLLKGNPIKDLRKARQYLDFEIARLEE